MYVRQSEEKYIERSTHELTARGYSDNDHWCRTGRPDHPYMEVHARVPTRQRPSWWRHYGLIRRRGSHGGSAASEEGAVGGAGDNQWMRKEKLALLKIQEDMDAACRMRAATYRTRVGTQSAGARTASEDALGTRFFRLSRRARTRWRAIVLVGLAQLRSLGVKATLPGIVG
jgi:hypothetical protein